MASNKKTKNGNTVSRNHLKGASETQDAAATLSGNPIGDRLWLDHFLYAIRKSGVFDDTQNRKLQTLIDREYTLRYKNR